MQNARENPLAAAAAAAAVSGTAAPIHNNIENLLDIDFDGAAPASAQKSPPVGMSGLEGLAGTPQRVASPAVNNGIPPSSATHNLDDLIGLSNGMGFSDAQHDVLNGFAGLDMSAASQPPPPPQQLSGQSGGKKTNQDLLDLF